MKTYTWWELNERAKWDVNYGQVFQIANEENYTFRFVLIGGGILFIDKGDGDFAIAAPDVWSNEIFETSTDTFKSLC